MKEFHSIKKNGDFQAVYKTGRSYANKYLIMYVLQKEEGNTRIGMSVSKKVGNSVVRHRLTRLLRESYRLNMDMFKDSIDIVVVARTTAKGKKYSEIESALLHLGKIHNILKESK